MPRQSRKAHILKENKGVEYPNQMIFFDTETWQEKVNERDTVHKLRLGSAIFWQRRHGKGKDVVKYYTFKTKEEIRDIILSHAYERRRLYVISHNLDFDMAVCGLYKVMREAGYELVSFWEKTPARFLKWVNGRKTIICLDNGNYFRGRLEDIGKDIGYEKLEIEFESCSEDELSTYNQRDTEILYKLWERWLMFCEENELGCFAQTLAGQAFNAFRHRFMRDKIYIHDHEEVLGLERQAYTGGRTECFYIGMAKESPIYVLDINSMYPFVMKEYEYPVKLVAYRKNVDVGFIRHYVKSHAMIAKVTVSTVESCFPYKVNGHVIYPVGTFTAFLCTPEILYALEKDMIKEVHEVAVYEKANIFCEYVEFFYQKRLEAKEKGEKMFAYFYKILMNSLYGKFGQKSTTWEYVGPSTADEPRIYRVYDSTSGKWYTIREHNGIMEQTVEEEEAFNSFPAIAAHVTAYSRMYLWTLINIAGLENVYYVDTDSIFTNEQGKDNLKEYIDESRIGYLKVDKTMQRLTIHGNKDYEWETGRKLKGIRASATQIDENTYVQEKWNNFASRIRMGNINTYVVSQQVKHLRREYTKGVVTASGRVIPWYMPYDEEAFYEACWNATGKRIIPEEQKYLIEYAKNIRKLVLKLGGVNDKDYESIPKWSKRKRGMTLDELVMPLQNEGIPVTSAEEVYNLLWQVTPSRS